MIVGYNGIHLSDVYNYYSSFYYGVARSVTFTWSRSSGVSTSSDSMWSVTSNGGSVRDVYLFLYSFGVAIRLFVMVEEFTHIWVLFLFSRWFQRFKYPDSQ